MNYNGNFQNRIQVNVNRINENNIDDEQSISINKQQKNCLQSLRRIKNYFQGCFGCQKNEYRNIQIDAEESPINRNQVSTTQQNLLKQKPKPGGLHNSESTCYMNAMIQALSSSDILINALKDLSKSHSNSSILLLYNLLNALNEQNINNETIMRNTNLLEDLIESVGWTKPSQQDAFELLSTLICSLYEKSNNKDEIEIPLRIKLLHEFQGIDISNKVQEYLGLSLNLLGNYENKPGVHLQYLISQYFESTEIDEDKSKLTRSSLYLEIPNILLIHIQANKWNKISGQLIKPIYYIQYEENMILWFDIANEINGKNRNLNEDRILGTQVEYHLKSIVAHAGNISGGHYIAYKKWQNEWYIADDESIIKEPLNMLISPYIMIYERSFQS